VRVRVARGLDDPQAMPADALAAAGVGAGPVRPVRPSLDDVFVALVGDRGVGEG